jgi:hypothetical protein
VPRPNSMSNQTGVFAKGRRHSPLEQSSTPLYIRFSIRGRSILVARRRFWIAGLYQAWTQGVLPASPARVIAHATKDDAGRTGRYPDECCRIDNDF